MIFMKLNKVNRFVIVFLVSKHLTLWQLNNSVTDVLLKIVNWAYFNLRDIGLQLDLHFNPRLAFNESTKKAYSVLGVLNQPKKLTSNATHDQKG